MIAEYQNSHIGTVALSAKYGMSPSTAQRMLRSSGVTVSIADRIRRRLDAGLPANSKGAKRSPEVCAAIRERMKGKATTKGTRRTEEQRAMFRMIELERVGRLRAAGKLLSDEERIVRDRTRRALKRMVHRILRMARVNKNRRLEAIVGYTKEQLRQRIEETMPEGMTFAGGGWHIDHRFPVVAFFQHGITDPAIINRLDNLQCLPANENRRKSGKYDKVEFRRYLESISPSYTNGIAWS